jgi:hypothetical protein
MKQLSMVLVRFLSYSYAQIIHKPQKTTLGNKRHFEEKNGECTACLKYSVLIFVEKIYIKCNIWRVAVRPFLYIGRTVLKG